MVKYDDNDSPARTVKKDKKEHQLTDKTKKSKNK